MRVMILAGGFGTRLAHIVKDVPKPMAPICGVPFLELQMASLQARGADQFIILTGYKADIIESYFAAHPKYSECVTFSRETKPLGTGGAVREGAKLFNPREPFIIVNGDTYLDCDLRCLMESHRGTHALATMVLKYQEDCSRYGTVHFADTLVTHFSEKGQTDGAGFINAGVYVVSPEVLDYFPPDGPFSLERDVFPRLSSEGLLQGYPCAGRFIDIGVEHDYRRAQSDLPQWIGEPQQRAVFFDRDGVVVEDTRYLRHIRDVHFQDDAIAFLKRYQEKGYLLIMCTNQAAIAKGILSTDDYRQVQDYIEEGLRARGLALTETFMCPYHPDGIIPEFTKCSYDRKPLPGMILRAADKYNVDLRESFMIGDKMTDIIQLPHFRTYLIERSYPISGQRCYRTYEQAEAAINAGE